MAVARFLLLLVVFLAVLQVVLFYDDLPEVMASHFDGAGAANGWSSKPTFFAIYAVIMVVTVGTFVGMPLIMRRLPTRLINLPHREYWLAPERREQTLKVFEVNYLGLGVLHTGFALVILQMVIDANLHDGPPVLTAGIGWPLIAYGIVFTGWLIGFLRRFRRPAANEL